MIISLLISFLINATSLWIVTLIVPGVSVSSTETLAIAAVSLGIVNALIRPVVQLISLPLSIITFGVFALIVNGLMLMLAAWFVPGFVVDGLLPAIIGAIILSLVSAILSLVLKSGR